MEEQPLCDYHHTSTPHGEYIGGRFCCPLHPSPGMPLQGHASTLHVAHNMTRAQHNRRGAPNATCNGPLATMQPATATTASQQ